MYKVDRELENVIVEKIVRLRTLKNQVEMLEAEIDAIKDDIKYYMGDETEMIAGAYKVTWKPVTTVNFDSKKFKAACPDIYSMYTRTSTTRRFNVA